MKKIRFFEHDEVFPRIAKAIEEFSMRSRNYIEHDEIVGSLLVDPEGSRLINWASGRAKLENAESKDWTRKQWGDNMVAWFSQKYTEGQSRWRSRFEREERDGQYAYRVRQSHATVREDAGLSSGEGTEKS
jgi:hypothetical protein